MDTLLSQEKEQNHPSIYNYNNMTNTETFSQTCANGADHLHPNIGFEGPEKRLQIDFRFKTPVTKDNKGLRTLDKDEWQNRVLDHAKCRIISLTQNKHFDAYLLSESSLFVYPTRVMLKTCGTTTLLQAIPSILAIATEFGMIVSRVMYSRKNFNFPHVQPAPHSCFDAEVQFLEQFFVGGKAVTLGPCESDHWNFYLADYDDNELSSDLAKMPILEVMMGNLNEKKMKQFVKRDDNTSHGTTQSSGIQDILPGSLIDGFLFDPCGYSMNGLLHNSYSTIHITPESHCSYVSYETNCHATLAKKSPAEYYPWVIQNVLKTFQPGCFMIAMYGGDPSFHCVHAVSQHLKNRYKLENMSLFDMEGGCQVSVCSFTSISKPLNLKKNPGLLSVLGMEKHHLFQDQKMSPQESVIHDAVMAELISAIAL